VRVRRSGRRALVLAAVAVLAACQPSATSGPPIVVTERDYSLCPQAGELPAKDITDRAVEILGARLTELGVETSTIAVGACLEVTASTTSAAQDAAVRAAMLGTGTIAFMSLPVGADRTTSVGGQPPDGTEPVLGGSDFQSAEVVGELSTGRPALSLRFSDAGAATLANWSRQHVGALTALVVDGVVVVLPTVNEPLVEGTVTLSLGETPPVPLDAVAAMINSGPLPPEWAQPERPQG
jgi:preprotein translocase subunit SecD